MAESCAYRPRRPPRQWNLRLRGLEAHLWQWGGSSAAQPPVVLLHGWLDSGASFQFIADACADRRALLALDWRGYGGSERPAQGYWFPDYLADLDALLDHLAPSTPVALVGHSMGGNLASLYAGLRPERVRALVNMEGFGLPRTAPRDAPARLRRWLDEARRAAPEREYESLAQLEAAIRVHHPRVAPERAAFLAGAWGKLDADGRVRLRSDPRHRWVNPVNYKREDAEACWRLIEAPTLLVAGGDSDYLRRLGADGAETALRSTFPRASFACIEGAGHMLHVEQPQRVARLLEDFLDAC